MTTMLFFTNLAILTGKDTAWLLPNKIQYNVTMAIDLEVYTEQYRNYFGYNRKGSV